MNWQRVCVLLSMMAMSLINCRMQNCWALVEHNVPYDYSELRTDWMMDVYKPNEYLVYPSPALIYIHGGCFKSGSKADIPSWVTQLSDEGITVFSVNYRLAPNFHYPAAIIDVQQAVRFIRQNAAELEIDPARIAVHGESAGGYLAAMLGVKTLPNREGQFDQYSYRVPYVSDWYGRMDFSLPQQQNSGVDCAEVFLGKRRSAQNAEEFHRASVLPYVDEQAADFHIIHGANDTQVLPIHSSLLAEALNSRNRSARIVYYEGESHGFIENFPAQELTRRFILSSLLSSKQKMHDRSVDLSSHIVRDPSPQLIDAGLTENQKNNNTNNDNGGFVSDRYFVSGSAYTYNYNAVPITLDTTLPELYNTVRAGKRFRYNVEYPPGVYRLTLHFAEKNPAVQKRGQRVFGVELNLASMAVPWISYLDVLALVGRDRAMSRTIDIISKTGRISFDFMSLVKEANAFVSAFEIHPIH